VTAVATPQRGRFGRTKPVGSPGVDRPRLLSDMHGAEKLGLIVAVIVGGIILGHLARYAWAAVYYNALETNPSVTAAWHSFLSVSWQRHLARFGIEGLYTGAVVQVVFYGIKRWPPKAAGWWTRYVKRFLLVPSASLPDQTLWCLALSWLWIVVWALPWGIAIAVILDLAHQGNTALVINTAGIPVIARPEVDLANWQQPLVGFACSFLGARHIIKGTAFHAQRLIIRERIDSLSHRTRPLTPAWWMHLFPYLLWRFEWQARRSGQSAERRYRDARHGSSRFFHRALMVVLGLFLLALVYQGWHVLTYLDWSWRQPFLMR
jgi:hypothetical protein